MTAKEKKLKEEKNKIKQEKAAKTREINSIKKEILNFLKTNNIALDMITQAYIDEYITLKMLVNRIDNELNSADLTQNYINKNGAVNVINNPLISERKHAANNLMKILTSLSKLKKESNAKDLKNKVVSSNPLDSFSSNYDK